MRQIGINLYPQKYNQNNMKVCSNNTENSESIFSDNTKVFGSGLAGTTFLNFTLPRGGAKILSKIKGLNILVMGFCAIGLLADFFRKSKEKESNDSIEINEKQEKPLLVQSSSYKQNQSKPLRIAVVDDFIKADENCGELKHGDIVTDVIKSHFPDAEIEKRELSTFSYSLQNIIDNVNRGVHYDAINLSCTYDFSVKLNELEIYDENNRKVIITKDNIDKYKMQIKEFVENKAKEEGYYYNAKEFIDKIEYLTDRKIPVFLSNNNNSGNEVSLSDLWDFNTKYPNNNNPYLITVSSNDKSENLYSRFSDIHEKSTLKLTRTSNGIDYTGDGKPNVTNRYYLNLLRTKNIFVGNSFATPLALIARLKK